MGRPLEGVRILDVTMVFAGPIAVKILAELGAEVIKVESHYRMDMPCRKLCYPENNPGDEPWNRGGYFHYFNTNKQGITLALHKPEGIEIFKRLARKCDVVVENFSPRVMRNFGLDYKSLCQIKPDIIMASISGFGQHGRYRDRTAYAYVVEATSGLTSISGIKGYPTISGTGYADWVMGICAAGAILSALHQQKIAGKGQYIDIAGLEALLFLSGSSVMEYTMNGKVKTAEGNRQQAMAPSGCYKCKSEEQWVAITVSSEDEWRSFCEASGNFAWAEEKKFSNILTRTENQDELDQLVEGWTTKYDRDEIVTMLSKAGVCVAPVLNAKEILKDEHLKQRGFFQMIDHPEVGRRPMQKQLSAKFNSDWEPPENHAPLLGQHNKLVFGKYLEMSDEEIEELERKGVIGTAPPEEHQLHSERGLDIGSFEHYNAIAKPETNYIDQLKEHWDL